MLFNSLPFVFSFAIFFVLYRMSGLLAQNRYLLFYGLIFYSYWNWKFSFLLLGSIAFNYFLGFRLRSSKHGKKLFWFGVVVNLGFLFFFKYALFAEKMLSDILRFWSSENFSFLGDIVLPVGISFYTFHNISYLVEVYQKRIQPETSFLNFAIYDLFFPLLLAGPIERPNSLLPQIQSPRILKKSDWQEGFVLFLQGIFWKAFFADHLAKWTQSIQDKDVQNSSPWLLALVLALRVYADFFGYSLCAKGLAQMMGFRLMQNFHRPLFATSPMEFWKRWHISLSTWLRDYIYIPLGGNRFGMISQNCNIMIVWILGGIWHGATYGYLVWGIYLGLCIVLANLWLKFAIEPFSWSETQKKFLRAWGMVLTFLSFALGLLLFQYDELPEIAKSVRQLFFSFRQLPEHYLDFLRLFLFVLPMLIFDLWQAYRKTDEVSWFLEERPIIFRLCLFFGFPIFCLAAPFEKQEFFYFQF